MTEHFDVVVLGTGNAGMAAAGVVREAGRSVAMVESRDVGGTCPIRGCVPKKVLVAAAQVLHQIELAPQHHIKVGRPELDWAALVEDGSNLVLGAHMVGHGAEEVIHIFSLAMKHGLTSEDLAAGVYAYPTFTSDLKFLV